MKPLGLLTVSQAADYLNVPRPTLYQHLREGRIPGIQIGGRWRIETQVLQRFLGVEDPESANEDHPLNEDREIAKLQQENQRLREIIAQQLLEIHEFSDARQLSTFTPRRDEE